jgi:hypothetical protein
MYAADKLTSLCVLSPYETSFELLDAVNTYDRPFEEWKAGEIVLSAPQGVVARPSRKGVTDTFVEDEFVVRFDQSSGTFDSFSKSGIRRTGEYEVADDAIGHVPFCDSSALSIENPPPGNFSVTVSVRRKPRMDLGAIVAGFNPSPSFRWKNAFLEATWNEGTTPDKVCMLALNRLGWRYET